MSDHILFVKMKHVRHLNLFVVTADKYLNANMLKLKWCSSSNHSWFFLIFGNIFCV